MRFGWNHSAYGTVLCNMGFSSVRILCTASKQTKNESTQHKEQQWDAVKNSTMEWTITTMWLLHAMRRWMLRVWQCGVTYRKDCTVHLYSVPYGFNINKANETCYMQLVSCYTKRFERNVLQQNGFTSATVYDTKLMFKKKNWRTISYISCASIQTQFKNFFHPHCTLANCKTKL